MERSIAHLANKVGTKRTRVVVRLAVALVALLMIGLANPASAATSGTWSSSGKSGVHSQGPWSVAYSRLYFSGYVKDTACDNHPVKIEIKFYKKLPGGFYEYYRKETVSNYKGCGNSVSFAYNTALGGRDVRVRVDECILGGGLGNIDSCAGGWATGDIGL